jgi:type 1 fimbria pilin
VKNFIRKFRLCARLLWLLLVLPTAADAQFRFVTNNGTITITGYVAGTNNDVTVPGMTNGFVVTTIGRFALSSLHVSRITLPDSILNIEKVDSAVLTYLTLRFLTV